MASIRTFIAVRTPQRINQNLERVIQRLSATKADYKWVEPENLHVTLNFAGNIVDTEIPEFCQLVKQAVQDVPAFEMSVCGAGGFPTPQQPRTIWIGIQQGAESLLALYGKIETVLYHWGINKDRNAYTPHITLGRIQRGGRWNPELLETIHRLRNHDGGFCTVDKVIVFSSFLDRTGPSHTPMATFALE